MASLPSSSFFSPPSSSSCPSHSCCSTRPLISPLSLNFSSYPQGTAGVGILWPIWLPTVASGGRQLSTTAAVAAAAGCLCTRRLGACTSKRIVRAQAGKDSIEVDERVIAAVGYLLPFLDGVGYGRFLFMQFPASQALLQPFLPILGLYKAFPFASVIAFFTLYLVVVRNPNFSRYVRFNTMQAVVLDVLLIIPSLVERSIPAEGGGIGYEFLGNRLKQPYEVRASYILSRHNVPHHRT